MPIRSRIGGALLALIVSACGSNATMGPDPIVTSVLDSYRISEGPPMTLSLRLRVDNRLPRPIYIAHCGEQIQVTVAQQGGGTWLSREFGQCPAYLQPPVVLPSRTVGEFVVSLHPAALGEFTGLLRVTAMVYTDSAAASTASWKELLPIDERTSRPFRVRAP